MSDEEDAPVELGADEDVRTTAGEIPALPLEVHVRHPACAVLLRGRIIISMKIRAPLPLQRSHSRPLAAREGWDTQVLIRTALLLVLAVLLAAGSVFAAKEFTMPKAEAAANYPAHDSHPNEMVTVGVDLYIGAKASIFKQNYADKDMVPLLVVITNNSSAPVELANMKVQLVTTNRRAKIEPASEDDLYRRFSRTQKRGDEPSKLPIPLPGRGPKVGVKKDVQQEIDAAMFHARAVEPHSTQAGFMFFDVSGISDPLSGARLYLTGLRDGSGQELMYFEVALEKAR